MHAQESRRKFDFLDGTGTTKPSRIVVVMVVVVVVLLVSVVSVVLVVLVVVVLDPHAVSG